MLGAEIPLAEGETLMTFRPDDAVEKTEVITWPADWWQAFKARFYPLWLLRYFPVKRVYVTRARFCPHMGVIDPKVHQEWLRKGERDDDRGQGAV